MTPRDSYRAGAYLDAAQRMGCSVTVATDAAVAIPEAAIAVSFADPIEAGDRILAQLDGRCDGVVGTDGAALPIAAAVAARLGLPGNPVDAVSTADDKLRQRAALAETAVPQPRFAVEGESDWCDYPAVVKPTDRAAGQGVIPVETPAELPGAVDRVRSLVGTDPVLIERLVSGVEVALEGLLVDGELHVLAVFDKPDETVGLTFPETLLIQPARIDDEALRRTTDVVRQAVTAIGLVQGPVHAECMIDGDQVWFLELAPRTIGGLCSRTLRPAGVGLEELVVGLALGCPLPPLEVAGPSGVLMLPVPAAGCLESVDGIDRARAVDGIEDVMITVGAGEAVEPLPEGDRYLG
ncbi:MAG: ATP-grasp domain-containing protein, partial [Acidimicrobiales bacterium]